MAIPSFKTVRSTFTHGDSFIREKIMGNLDNKSYTHRYRILLLRHSKQVRRTLPMAIHLSAKEYGQFG